jgi:hypothetical protein
MSKVRNLVFDCNETILDLTTVTPVFQRLFGDPRTMRPLVPRAHHLLPGADDC